MFSEQGPQGRSCRDFLHRGEPHFCNVDTIQELVMLRSLYGVSANLVDAVDESTPKFHLPERRYLVEGLWQCAH